jgi:hypothetical protein
MYCAIVAHDYLHSRVRVVFYLHLVYAIFSCDYMDVSSLKVGVVVLIATGEDGRERNKDAGKIPKAGPARFPSCGSVVQQRSMERLNRKLEKK